MTFESVNRYISNATAKELGWESIVDLYFHFPQQVVNKDNFQINFKVGSKGVWKVTCQKHLVLGKIHIVQCKENIKLVFFKSYKGLYSMFKGVRYVFGAVSNMYGGHAIVHPKVIYSSTPFYPSNVTGLGRAISKAIDNMPKLPEWLPDRLVKKMKLMSWDQAIKAIHANPKDERALLRLAVDNIAVLLYIIAKERSGIIAFPMFEGRFCANFFHQLRAKGMQLTHDQAQAIEAVKSDMRNPGAMNRIIHGEVGSGKTIIASFACLLAVDNSYTAIVLCPTTALASQHYKTLTGLGLDLKIVLCSGNTRESIDDANIIVASHALLYRDLSKLKVGLVVIDEEHKFGASQKLKVLQYNNAHRLLLSATPIPRSSYLIKYGYYKVSNLSRVHVSQVETFLYPEAKLDKLENSAISAAKKRKSQVYWICHDIEVTLANRAKSMRSKGLEPIVIHGKLENKSHIIDKFASGGGILLATTVVEVGIDIPTADIIVIETPCNFGLAQLHQLRGRVGRSDKKGYCCLVVPSKCGESCLKRLNTIKDSDDCKLISELDLKTRGPGSIDGSEQSGFIGMRYNPSIDVKIGKTELDELKSYLYSCMGIADHPINLAVKIYNKDL